MDLLKVSEVQITYKTKVKPSERPAITTSNDAVKILRPFFEQDMEYKELFYALYMNRANKVLGVVKISEGGTTSTVVDVKMIAQPAIMMHASAAIICHNHPSGNLKPSDADFKLTKTVKEALNLFEIKLLDSIILTSESHTSFADEGNV